MTREEYIENERKDYSKKMEQLEACPRLIEEVADKVEYICPLSDRYHVNVGGEFTLSEVKAICHGREYKLISYSLSYGDYLDVIYNIYSVDYCFTVSDAEKILPVLSNGKCSIVEEEKTTTNRAVVCNMGEEL